MFKKKFGDTSCTHLPQLVDVLGRDLFNFHKYYWWFHCVSNIIQSQIDQFASNVEMFGKMCSEKNAHLKAGARDYYGAFLRVSLRRAEKFTLTVQFNCVLSMS